mgnify:CR=1 FL=1
MPSELPGLPGVANAASQFSDSKTWLLLEPPLLAGAETVRMLINERRNPETGRSLDQAGIRADNDGQPPIAGYDLTQTVPKSVSILWAFADQDTRRAIDECLHQAADMTIGYFEAEYAATRAGAGGGGGGGGRRVAENKGRSSMRRNWLVSACPGPGKAGNMDRRSSFTGSGDCQCMLRKVPDGVTQTQAMPPSNSTFRPTNIARADRFISDLSAH